MAEDTKFAFIDGKFVNRVSGEAIPDDEPVMIFRARDKHALQAITAYLQMIEDPHHRYAVIEKMVAFSQFALAHSERMKEPGITRHIKLGVFEEHMGRPKRDTIVGEHFTGTHCSICGKDQYNSIGGITCPEGHGGADPAMPLDLSGSKSIINNRPMKDDPIDFIGHNIA